MSFRWSMDAQGAAIMSEVFICSGILGVPGSVRARS